MCVWIEESADVLLVQGLCVCRGAERETDSLCFSPASMASLGKESLRSQDLDLKSSSFSCAPSSRCHSLLKCPGCILSLLLLPKDEVPDLREKEGVFLSVPASFFFFQILYLMGLPLSPYSARFPFVSGDFLPPWWILGIFRTYP